MACFDQKLIPFTKLGRQASENHLTLRLLQSLCSCPRYKTALRFPFKHPKIGRCVSKTFSVAGADFLKVNNRIQNRYTLIVRSEKIFLPSSSDFDVLGRKKSSRRDHYYHQKFQWFFPAAPGPFKRVDTWPYRTNLKCSRV